MNLITDDEYKRIFKRASIAACRLGFANEASDVAQAVVLSFVQNPATKQTVNQAVIDYVRANGERVRGGAFRVSLRGCAEFREEIFTKGLDKITQNTREELLDFERYLHLLEGEERCLIVLSYVWGLSHVEIAYCFGIDNPSTISYRIRKIHHKIKVILDDKRTT